MSMRDLLIRNATVADIQPMAALLKELFAIETDFQFDGSRQHRGLQMMLDGCGKHRCVRVAEIQDCVVGMCSAQTLISTAEGGLAAVVEDLVVGRQFRGRGIGNRLIQSVEAWAAGRGIQRLQLLADQTNQPGLRFYSRQQWQPTRLICLRKRV
ncbi:MAG: GNAT family N-acetyltransferase [Desulfobacteraceae bacterium]|nr:MAG: GNAT family N-acetyltransferase [Desulfobacteraceae bacterium]